MSNVGRMVYVPKRVLDKLGYIKNLRKFNRRSSVWDEFDRLVDVGLNVDDFYSVFFGKRK